MVQKYLQIFYESGCMDDLAEICHQDLKFIGPFLSSGSLEAYVGSLKNDPPESSIYEIIEWFENDHKINVFYQFSKDDINTLMSQYFECRDGKISKITLIFDSKVFE